MHYAVYRGRRYHNGGAKWSGLYWLGGVTVHVLHQGVDYAQEWKGIQFDVRGTCGGWGLIWG